MSIPCGPSIKNRFDGADKEKNIIEALMLQTLVRGNIEIATELARKVELIEIEPHAGSNPIIQQGGADNDLYFIISGEVNIIVNGRYIAERSTGTHVGEMTVLDLTSIRSATVEVKTKSLFAKISEKDFSIIANKHPDLWRIIAVEIAKRLRERNKFFKERHNQPVIFIGSSSERIDIANEIKAGFNSDPFVVNVWNEGIFKASRTSIESLVEAVNDSDFAILVISPDDSVRFRGIKEYVPRDNILFELGLFMGGLGRERTYIVQPDEVRLPSDLFGVTTLRFKKIKKQSFFKKTKTCSTSLCDVLAPVCADLRHLITEKGPK